MIARHACDDSFDESVARGNKLLERNGLGGHALESAQELSADVLGPRRQNLEHRPGVTYQVDDEGGPQRVVDTFLREQVADVEEVARVFAGSARAPRGDRGHRPLSTQSRFALPDGGP